MHVFVGSRLRVLVTVVAGLLITVVVGLLLLAVLPAGLPGQPSCGDSDWTCRLNVNSGALTAIALLLAGVTGLVAYLDYSSGRRERVLDKERAADRFSSVYFDALYEALHNLFHIAEAFGGPGRALDQLDSWPEYDLRYAAKLLDPPNSDYMRPEVRPYVDHMLRNDLYIQKFPDTPDGRSRIADDTGYLAEHATRFLLEAWRCEEAEANALFNHLKKECKLGSLTAAEQEIKRRGFRIRLRRSDAERKDTESGKLLWWFDDSHACTHELFRELRELGDPPSRPPRPEAPRREPEAPLPRLAWREYRR
jgi:hypothetical protein